MSGFFVFVAKVAVSFYFIKAEGAEAQRRKEIHTVYVLSADLEILCGLCVLASFAF